MMLFIRLNIVLFVCLFAHFQLRAQEADYVNFYRTFYVPHNATLSIAGDIDVAQTKKWIDLYFASIPNGEKLNVYRDKEFLKYVRNLI